MAKQIQLKMLLILLYVNFYSLEGVVSSDLNETITRLNHLKSSRPDSCREVVSNLSRVVVILSSGLEVMCDTETDGGGWTIFQRRINGQLSFYRGWEDYKYGFGDYVGGEFYLGNENIHKITTKRRHELRVDFNFHHARFFAKYARFKIYGEPEGYRLKVNGFTGNAGDSLTYQNDMRFATIDRDTATCAKVYKGAWWYNGCHNSNLNGIWGSIEYGVGMNWFATTGHHLSVTMTEMKFRPVS